MSFRDIPSAVGICNKVLSRIAQAPITNIEPPQPAGTASRACALWYKPTVARLLEIHHWGLATKRATLTATTNARDAEWLYAYEKPADMAFPVALSPLSGVGGQIQYYRGLQGLLGMLYGKPVFLLAGRVLYARAAGPIDYVSYDITEADFSATFENIVILSMLANVTMEITKNKKLADAFKSEAMNEINVAIAQNLNSGNQRYGEGPTETELARGVGYGYPWDWFPGPNG